MKTKWLLWDTKCLIECYLLKLLHEYPDPTGLTGFSWQKCPLYLSQVCVALLNYGITRSPFLASCLREIQFILAKYNIELKAEYIPSKDNSLADLCSRAFSSDVHYRNFDTCLINKTFILENLRYEYFDFEYSM